MKPRLVFPIRGRQDEMGYGKLPSGTTDHGGWEKGNQGWIKIVFAAAC